MPMSTINAPLQPSWFKTERTKSAAERRFDFADGELPVFTRPRSFFWRLADTVSSMRFRRNGIYAYHAAPSEDDVTSETLGPRQKPRGLSLLRRFKFVLLRLPLFILALFGILHIVLVLFGRLNLFWDLEQYNTYLPAWVVSDDVGESSSKYPSDATRDVLPIRCHSHNDYWRRIPLFDAIHWGCTSVEADVWRFEGEDELFVGHSTASLTRNRTFTKLYVDPLVNLLNSMNPVNEFNNVTRNGVFDEDAKQTLVLLVDFKTNGHDLFPIVQKQLEPLRENGYLSYWNGQDFVEQAVTVVGTGNTPFDLVVQNQTYRDIFFDAPLDEFHSEPADNSESNAQEANTRLMRRNTFGSQGKTGTDTITSTNDFNSSTSYYASVSYLSSIGRPWTGRITDNQLNRIRGQIKGAQRQGLKVRYWDTPSWPTSLRNHVWQTLLQEGVDMLNVDDLKGASIMDWTVKIKHDWFDAR